MMDVMRPVDVVMALDVIVRVEEMFSVLMVVVVVDVGVNIHSIHLNGRLTSEARAGDNTSPDTSMTHDVTHARKTTWLS